MNDVIDGRHDVALCISDGQVNGSSVGHDGTVHGDGQIYPRVSRRAPRRCGGVAGTDENHGLIDIDDPTGAVARVGANGDGPRMTVARDAGYGDRFGFHARHAVAVRTMTRDEPRCDQGNAARCHPISQGHIGNMVRQPRPSKNAPCVQGAALVRRVTSSRFSCRPPNVPALNLRAQRQRGERACRRGIASGGPEGEPPRGLEGRE